MLKSIFGAIAPVKVFSRFTFNKLFTFLLFYAKITSMNIIKINDNSNKLFYIGGVVRDELLGRKSIDIDITYVGNAIEYCSKFGEVVQENPDFGTVRVAINPLPNFSHSHSDNCEILPSHRKRGQKVTVDFASTRSESYPRKGHLPVVEKIGCSLKEDVMRRDFTVNALAKSVMTGEIVDYVGGLEDLKNKKLRVLHDESFIDDPTRIIRGLKFATRFGFELEEHTKKLQDEYLANINYDMSYKRVKKELIETFSLNSQSAFKAFVDQKIYKLITLNDVKMPKVNIEGLVNDYYTPHLSYGHPLPVGAREEKKQPNCPVAIWLIYVGILCDLSRLPLTKIEQKILDDVPKDVLKTDFELYKTFQNTRIETILLYAILKDEAGARHYLDDLQKIKLEITGKDLQNLGIKPSPEYQKIFDEVLKVKLKNPSITKEDEIKLVKELV